jgi:replicative DNA helicase
MSVVSLKVDATARDQRLLPMPAAAVLEDFFPGLEAAQERLRNGKLPGVPTGLKWLDQQLLGLPDGLTLLNGEPGAGKTSMALQIARAASEEGIPTLYLALDEAARFLSLKLFASQAGLSFGDFRRGRGDLQALKQAVEDHRDQFRHLTFWANPEPPTVSDAALMLRERRDLAGSDRGLLVVDYLQVYSARLNKSTDAFQGISATVGDLAACATSEGFACLAVGSQNRASQNTRSLQSGWGSADLEYAASAVINLTRSDQEIEDRRSVQLVLAKNRLGPAGASVDLVFEGSTGRFWQG